MAEKLIIFSRFPKSGSVKTRLIPALGADGAARLQRRLTEDTLALARRLAAERPVELELRFTGGTAGDLRSWLGNDLQFRDQGSGNLGERMARALELAHAERYQPIVLIGADCPSLSIKILLAAFTSLATHDLVLGPASDGGYYLIGLSRPATALFNNQPWGRPDLLEKTLAAAGLLGLKYQLLPELDDVDRPEDLHHLCDYPGLERS